ncbi:Hypothetical predicted protein [Pelobates cultripes]|uniref:Phospholipase A2 inhibitor and Ly6/PLAUR domain-containing protein-like n=1 Tax=Pelobates cultripes TaxID=61616 RepID=A0AAD1WQI4_PELCU|nr:Hypothetical predicted protein [Pelobates cultripes]
MTLDTTTTTLDITTTTLDTTTMTLDTTTTTPATTTMTLDTTTTTPTPTTTLYTNTGGSLYCIECVNTTGSTCTGSNVACPTGSICGSQYTVTRLDRAVFEKISRKCLPEKQCSVSGSYSFNREKITTATSCCNSSGCTPTFPTLPAGSSEPNGVTCPTCSIPGSIVCYSGENIQCTGNETMCFLRGSTITENLQSLSIRGCATKSVCDNEIPSSVTGFTDTNVRFFCTVPGDDCQCKRCQSFLP